MISTETMSVSTITILCYLIAEFIKVSRINNKWIPITCLSVGGVLGIVGLYIIPDFPADNVMSAVAVGIVSGGAATGINQTFKKLSNYSVQSKNEETKE